MKIAFNLLDAARVEGQMDVAKTLNPSHISLYKGRSEEVLADVAPFLFSYSHDTEYARWLNKEGWGNAWGVFVVASISFDDMHRHFRKFLIVKTEDNKELYFRFYDPRVLRIFLPTCNPQQLKDFFGPITTLIVEDENPSFALIFRLENYQLKCSRILARQYFELGTIMAADVNNQPPMEVVAPVEKTEPQRKSFTLGGGGTQESTDNQPPPPRKRFLLE